MTKTAPASSFGTLTASMGSTPTTMTLNHVKGAADANHTFSINSSMQLQVEIPSGTNPYSLSSGVLAATSSETAQTIDFKYDSSGLRVRKTVNGVDTDYLLHGKLVMGLTRGSDKLHFFYDAQSRPALVEYNGTVYTYVHNLQGDIVAILDASGTKVVEYKYDAWGRPIYCDDTLKTTLGALNPFRYRGYVYDEETGLYYLRSRYYDPEWGRFLNADSILGTWKLLNHNMYSYCRNCPIINIDPDGLAAAALNSPIAQTLWEMIINAWQSTQVWVGNSAWVWERAPDFTKTVSAAKEKIAEFTKDISDHYAEYNRTQEEINQLIKNHADGHEYDFYRFASLNGQGCGITLHGEPSDFRIALGYVLSGQNVYTPDPVSAYSLATVASLITCNALPYYDDHGNGDALHYHLAGHRLAQNRMNPVMNVHIFYGLHGVYEG